MRKIVGINIKPVKKQPAEKKQEIQLIRDFGPEGDAYGGPGDRQITLLGEEDLINLEKDRELGLCIDRFIPNLAISGSSRDLKKEERYSIGEIVIKISRITKKCHDGCRLRDEEKRICRLPSAARFASIENSGLVKINDPVNEL